MKYLILTPLLFFSAINSPLNADIIYETKDYGYQRKLSYLAFVYGFELFNKSNDVDKDLLARELSVMAFYYWLDSNRNNELHNRGIEIVIKTKVFPSLSKYGKSNKKLFFGDPLLWRKYDRPKIKPLPIYKMDKQKYLADLNDFSTYLNSPISEVKTRVREIK